MWGGLDYRRSRSGSCGLWWKDGQSLDDIGWVLGKHAASVFGVVFARGGVAPSLRKRALSSLTHSEQEEVSRGLVSGLSSIALL